MNRQTIHFMMTPFRNLLLQLVAVLTISSSLAIAQEVNIDFPLGPIGGAYRITAGSGVARIVSMPEGTPGYAAGLRANDYISSAFGNRFSTSGSGTGSSHHGFTQEMGFAIDRAEGADGVLPLTVIRSGIGTVSIDVQLEPKGTYGPAYPINSAKYDETYEAAVAHLHSELMRLDGGSQGGVHYLSNWSGLAMLGHPDWDKTDGPRPYRNSINLVRDHKIAIINAHNYSPTEGNMILADGSIVTNPNHTGESFSTVFSNWQLGPAVMFLAEYYAKTGDESVLPVLQRGAEICANVVQWWRQPHATNVRRENYDYIKGLTGHAGVGGDYPHIGWGIGFNVTGVHIFNALAFARKVGVDMSVRPRDGADFGFDPYPSTLAPAVPEDLRMPVPVDDPAYDPNDPGAYRPFRHSLDEKFEMQWDYMGRRSMTLSSGYTDGHIW